jgi:hypothetical protein
MPVPYFFVGTYICMSTYKVQLTENTTQRFVNELFTEIRLDLIFTR